MLARRLPVGRTCGGDFDRGHKCSGVRKDRSARCSAGACRNPVGSSPGPGARNPAGCFGGIARGDRSQRKAQLLDSSFGAAVAGALQRLPHISCGKACANSNGAHFCKMVHRGRVGGLACRDPADDQERDAILAAAAAARRGKCRSGDVVFSRGHEIHARHASRCAYIRRLLGPAWCAVAVGYRLPAADRIAAARAWRTAAPSMADHVRRNCRHRRLVYCVSLATCASILSRAAPAVCHPGGMGRRTGLACEQRLGRRRPAICVGNWRPSDRRSGANPCEGRLDEFDQTGLARRAILSVGHLAGSALRS